MHVLSRRTSDETNYRGTPAAATRSTQAARPKVAAGATTDDDEELARLRAARLDEIKRERSGPRFGRVAPPACGFAG